MLLRIPVRTNTDDRYFTDEYQALPTHGYTRFIQNMYMTQPLITVRQVQMVWMSALRLRVQV